MLIGWTLILLSLAAGRAVAELTTVPSEVAGLLLLCAVCLTFPLLARRAARVSTWLIGWMSLFFVPPLVSVAGSLDVVGERSWTTAGALAISLPAGALATAGMYTLLTRNQRGDPAEPATGPS